MKVCSFTATGNCPQCAICMPVEAGLACFRDDYVTLKQAIEANGEERQ